MKKFPGRIFQNFPVEPPSKICRWNLFQKNPGRIFQNFPVEALSQIFPRNAFQENFPAEFFRTSQSNLFQKFARRNILSCKQPVHYGQLPASPQQLCPCGKLATNMPASTYRSKRQLLATSEQLHEVAMATMEVVGSSGATTLLFQATRTARIRTSSAASNRSTMASCQLPLNNSALAAS